MRWLHHQVKFVKFLAGDTNAAGDRLEPEANGGRVRRYRPEGHAVRLQTTVRPRRDDPQSRAGLPL
jgi:hypothetical protein